MSSLSNLETTTSLPTLSNNSLLIDKRINKIKKSLLNLGKEEILSFNPLKVKIYKEEIETQNHKSEIKIPTTFKRYFEDFQKNKNIISQIESGIISHSNINSAQIEQIESSDLVNSE